MFIQKSLLPYLQFTCKTSCRLFNNFFKLIYLIASKNDIKQYKRHKTNFTNNKNKRNFILSTTFALRLVKYIKNLDYCAYIKRNLYATCVLIRKILSNDIKTNLTFLTFMKKHQIQKNPIQNAKITVARQLLKLMKNILTRFWICHWHI